MNENEIRAMIGEATAYDKKQILEEKDPRSWLKSVSAFANGIGGVLIFGIADKTDEVTGLPHAEEDAEKISALIRDRMDPIPIFELRFSSVDRKTLIILDVKPGSETPYYYVGKNERTAYHRVGNESVVCDAAALRRLVLKGSMQSFDSLPSQYQLSNFSFFKLKSLYKNKTGKDFSDDDFESFGLASKDGYLTNAGALLADESPIRHSRIFCTRWFGLSKASGVIEALDDREFSGSILILLDSAEAFIRNNTKKRWKKLDTYRIEMPDYPERAVTESLINAIIHRDYLGIGSEIHIDIFDDRMEIYSPGGMFDGTFVQDLNTDMVPSKRRNPVIADLFDRMHLMERRGSGFKKINEDYRHAFLSRPDTAPKYYSNHATFIITLYNLNYGISAEDIQTIINNKTGPFEQKTGPFEQKTGPLDEKTGPSVNETVRNLKLPEYIKSRLLNRRTRNNAEILFEEYGFDFAFGRIDVMHKTGLSRSAAAELLALLKLQNIIIPSQEKNKYRFMSVDETDKEDFQ